MLKLITFSACLLAVFAAAASAGGIYWDIQTVATQVDGAHNNVHLAFKNGVPLIGYMDEYASPTLRNLYLSVQTGEYEWEKRFVDTANFDKGLSAIAVDSNGATHLSYITAGSQYRYSKFTDDWNQSTQIIYQHAMDCGLTLDNFERPVYEFSYFLSKTNHEYLRMGKNDGGGYYWNNATGFPSAGIFDWESGAFDDQGNMMLTLNHYEAGMDYGSTHYIHRTAGGIFSDYEFGEDILGSDGLFVGDIPTVALLERVSDTESQIVLYEYDNGEWLSRILTDFGQYRPVVMDAALDNEGNAAIAFAEEDGSIWYMYYDTDMGGWSSPHHVYGPLVGAFDVDLLSLELAFDAENLAAIAFYDPVEESVMYALDPPLGGVVPEPSVLIMIGAGLAAVAGIVRRKVSR